MITDPNMGDLEYLDSGVFSESNYEDQDSIRGGESEISLLDSSTIMPSVLYDEQDNPSAVAAIISEMREMLASAIQNLEIPKRNSRQAENREESLLDFAMLMAFQSMELMFYKRAIECTPKYAASIERDFVDNEWERIEPDKQLVSILERLDDLIYTQESTPGALNKDPEIRRKFADNFRKGLRVIPGK